MTADNLAPLCAEPTAGTVMAKFGPANKPDGHLKG